MTKSVALSPAQVENISDLLEMIRVYHHFDHLSYDRDLTQSFLTQVISSEHLGRIWLIQVDQQMAGYLLLTFGFSIEFLGRDAFIDELFLKDNFRGQGVGKKALNLAIEAAKKLDIKAIHLEVVRKNTNAKTLYEKVGFEDHDRFLMTYWTEKH